MSFYGGFPRGAPPRVFDTISAAFGIVENSKGKIAEILADGRLSREGKDAAIAAALSKGPAGHMAQLRDGIERDLAGIQSEKEAMRRRVVEANAFPESRKTQVRQWLRSLTDQERLALAHTTKDPLIVESIVTAPFYLSGVKEEHSNVLTQRIVEDQNHERIVELAPLEAAYEEAQAAIAVATADLKRESGISTRAFEAA